MSHRITTKTEITNKKLAIQALKTAAWGYTESGDTLRVLDGPMRNATVNTSTGTVSGDTDWHRRGGGDGLQALNKFYSEALIRAETQKQGGQIESRTLDKDQNIILIAQFG
jgi:hypothetical protein